MSLESEYYAYMNGQSKQDNKKKKKKSASLDEEYYSAREELGIEEEDDIAPVRTTKKKVEDEEEDEGFQFFQRGALEDGITVGNIAQAILGTAGDVGLGVVKGASKLVGGVIDAGAYGIAGIADAAGNDKFADKLRVMARENVIDEAFEGTDSYLDQYSLLGRTLDSAAEGVGYMGGILLTGGLGASAGLGSVGTTILTSGVVGSSAAGVGMSEAYQGGATDEEAAEYGVREGIKEAIVELASGGFGKVVKAVGLSRGLGGLDDIFARKLTDKIANQTARNFAEFGIKSGFEGLEEVVSGIGSAVNKQMTYMSDKELQDLVADENLLEQFVVGAVTSGVAQSGIVPGMKSGSLAESNKKGRDFISGMTESDQKVVDRLVENQIAEQEKDGKKLSKKEKDEVYDDIMESLERGEISLDTIAEVVDGEGYKAYQDMVGKEEQTMKELAELYEGDALQKELSDFMANAESQKMRSELDEKVFGLVKNGKLAESYYERGRRGQSYQADLSKYDEKQRAVIERAVNSGVLNNTRRTHEFVDMIAKISADKGVLFDFTSNEKLKGSIYAVDGKTVNGFVTEDGITLNLNSAKALNSVVGHEITHVLEGTKLYDELQTVLFDYAKSRKSVGGNFDSEYKERLYNTRQLYKDMEGYQGVEGFNKIKNEVAADLVGDYLFTDTDFVNHLVKNRNVFQKIYDEIKYLHSVSKAGSEEEKKLLEVKRTFEKAYGQKNTTKNGGTTYSLTGRKTPSYKELTAKNPVHIVNVKGDIESGSYDDMKTAVANKATREGWFEKPHHNDDTDSLIFLTEKSFTHAYSNLTADFGEDTIRCMGHIPEIIENAVLAFVDDPKNPNRQETKVYTFFGAIDGVNGIEPVKLTVKEYDFKTMNAVPKNIRAYFEENGIMESYDSLYDAHALEVVGIEGIKKESDASGKVNEHGSQAQATSDSTISVADLLNLVNGDARKYIPTYSVSDSDYLDAVNRNDMATAQQMVDEAARESGYNYRGVHRARAEFTVFDRNKIGSGAGLQFGDGFYISLDIKDKATADYADSAYGKVKMDLYVKMQSPLELGKPISEEIVDRMQRDLVWFGDDESVKYGVMPEIVREQLVSGDSYEQMEAIRWLAQKNVMEISEFMQEYGFDGIISENEYVSQAVVWDENQLKSADPVTYDDSGNVISLSERFKTENKDIRYSVSDSDGKQLTKEQQDYFKDSKVRDENGNLKVMYHGTERGGFHTFDGRFSDDDISFFFVDSPEVAASYSGTTEIYEAKSFNTAEDANKFFEEIGRTEYRVVEKDGEYTLYDDGGEVATSTSLAEIYEEFCEYEGVGYGNANYKVYLNLKNPLVVDAKGKNWNNISREYSQEVAGRYNSLTAEEKAALTDLAEWGEYGIFKDEMLSAAKSPDFAPDLASAYEKLGGANANLYDAFSIAEDNFSDESIKRFAVKQMNTRDYAQKAKAEGYDGVIFNNIVDIGGYGGDYTPSTVAIAFDSNQIKSVANEKPTADKDIRYSLSKDTEGRELSPAIQKRFGKSKVVDEDGNLKVVYHGTATGEFSIFDKSKGSVEGDFGSGFYFTDNEADVSEHYEGGGPDFDNKVARLAEQIADEEDIDYDEAEEKAREQLYKGSHKFEVYLNIENPAIVGKTMLLDGESYHDEYNEEDYDDYDDYLADVEQLLADDIENIVWEVEKNVDVYSTDGIADILYDAYAEGGIGVEDLKKRLNDLYLEDNEGNLVANEVARQIIESLGFDGIIDPTVSGKWNMDIEEGTTHYIVFKPNQIKAVTNQNPTDNPDIHRSLSNDGEAPIRHGNYNVYGEDIALARNRKQATSEIASDKASDTAPVTVAENATVPDMPEEEEIAPVRENPVPPEPPVQEESGRQTRKDLHHGIVERIRGAFQSKGYDLDAVLKKAKNLSTFSTVDNTPQRVMEKALGYKEGQILSDITVNQVAQNETEGIKWLNKQIDTIRQLSEQYGIKPGSKESAAAQMYAEGFYVGEQNDIIEYGDAELAQDFPDANVRVNIKRLAGDTRIRQMYDDTLAMINESRARNLYPEIQKLDNYFLHFRAMDDTFSRLGLPFNPNDIRAKDLPTDLNGVTADLKPGQPFFASAMHRTGKRTSFDLLGGLERYMNSAKNQIYHIDDIQTLRALRNYIADTYGQANGLEGLDELSEEEAQDRINQVFDSHLSTFAKFLNEEANILAGKTALIDRGLEGIIGRRGITFLNELNKQVGSNMVGYNVSSSLTNFLPVVQTFAKGNKAAFVKAFAQTVASKVSGRTDSFLENSPVVIRRKGVDRFYRTFWQSMADPGYAMMSMVDSVSTELIARTKYNELVSKGMDSQKAHYETDKWVSRLMGDRSIGQMPQLYNSRMLGLITKFQLEVRNQLDSQFYDTIQEAKVSNEHIQNEQARNARTAAKVASTFVQLAVAQHLFGMAFESVAGYNPAFDIIEVLMTAFGFDDDEDSEDTALDNLEQGMLALLEDLPYASTFLDGGRIPIASALPIREFVTGQDEWGNDKSRWDTLKEVAPYYLLPGGYGQMKKTAQGLGMFSDDHPIAGSYTDSGNLRFPVEDTVGNRIKAGIFGQWANENARDYFDNERNALKEKQIQEFIDVEMPIRDYWEYREGLSKQEKLEDKFDYIADLDLPVEKKNILINNIVDRKEAVDMTGYEDFSSYEEFDFAAKNPEKYDYLQANGISYAEYDASEESREAYNWAFKNPEKATFAKAVCNDVVQYRRYTGELYDIKADKDSDGDSIRGSRKEKVLDWLNNLDADYGTKILLFKSEYNADDTYNLDIVNYLDSRDDISYEEKVTILKDLGFTVANGRVYWD